MKPTKFDLMRIGRHRAENAARECGWAPLAQATEPAVPSMEIDGVRYAEAPETSGCTGCTFTPSGKQCNEAGTESLRVFGGDCADRRTIYIKAA